MESSTTDEYVDSSLMESSTMDDYVDSSHMETSTMDGCTSQLVTASSTIGTQNNSECEFVTVYELHESSCLFISLSIGI